MAFSSILRRPASSFAPLAARALRSQRNGHFSIFTALNLTRILSSEPRLSPFLPPHSYSTKRPSSDENLLRLLDSEIQCAEKLPVIKGMPRPFPFIIEDKPGFKTITLSKKYKGEVILVGVVKLETGEDGGDDDNEKANQSSIAVDVNIAKGNGQFIEINYTAYRDEIVIECLAVENPENYGDQTLDRGLNFKNLDENLQKALHENLQIRGIKPSMNNFLHMLWLKNLKKFVEA